MEKIYGGIILITCDSVKSVWFYLVFYSAHYFVSTDFTEHQIQIIFKLLLLKLFNTNRFLMYSTQYFTVDNVYFHQLLNK